SASLGERSSVRLRGAKGDEHASAVLRRKPAPIIDEEIARCPLARKDGERLPLLCAAHLEQSCRRKSRFLFRVHGVLQLTVLGDIDAKADGVRGDAVLDGDGVRIADAGNERLSGREYLAQPVSVVAPDAGVHFGIAYGDEQSAFAID